MTSPIGTAYIALRPTVAGFKNEAAAQLRPQLAGVSAEAKHLGTASSGATRDLGRLSRGMLAGSGAAGGLGRSLAFASTAFLGGAGIVAGIRGAIGITATFQRELNVLQAVSGASNEQLGQLSAKAKALGRDLTLPATSAADAAEAMTELAKGGLTVQNTLSAAKGVLQLSAAAQIDNATAATITARALNAFGLQGTQAVHVADVLANAANVSTGEITDMALALQQSAAVAHQAGLSITDTAAAISILANAGVVGSDAGTSLKTFLQRIVPVSGQARREMAALGVEFKDAGGNILPLPQIIESYKNALQNLSPAQRQSALQIIFGTDAIRAANILINAGAPAYNRMVGLLDRQGAAAKLAGAQMKGLSGAWEGFKSNIQTAAIDLGEKALPALTAGVRAASNAVSTLQSSDQVRQVLVGIRDVATTIGPPLLAAAHAAIEVSQAVGAPALLAGVVAYKAVGLAGRAAAAGQALYARSVAAATAADLRRTVAASTSATAQGAEAAAARKASASNISAASALNLYAGSLTRTVPLLGAAAAESAAFAEASTVAAAASVAQAGGAAVAGTAITGYSAAVAAATARLELLAASEIAAGAAGTVAAAGGLRAFASGLGRLAFGAVGGTFGAIALGTAAAAAGIVFLATREDDLERATRHARDAFEGLNTQLSATRTAAQNVATATRGIQTDKLAVQAAELAVARAKANLATTNAIPGSLAYKEAQLAVLQAQDQLRQAEAQLTQGRRDAQKADAGQIAQQNKNIDATNARIAATRGLITAIRDQVEAGSLVAAGGVAVRVLNDEQQKQQAIEKTSDAFDKQAEKVGGITTPAGRAALALEALTRSLSELPTDKQIKIAFGEAAAGKSLQRILQALGFTLAQAKALSTPSGVATGFAFGQGAVAGLTQSGPLFVQAYADLLNAASEAAKPAAAAAADANRKALEAAANEQKALQAQLKVQDRVVKNREAALKTANTDLADARQAVLDQAHSLGQARQALGDAQQQLADTITQGRLRVTDAVNQAKQNLSSIGSSLAQAVNDFLQKTGGTKLEGPLQGRFKQLRDQILAGGGGDQTAQAARELAARVQAQQQRPQTSDADKITQRFADAADLLNKGAINAAQFNRRITTLLSGAGVTAGRIQATQGVAAADQFRAELAALRQQAAAITTGPQRPGTGLQVSIVRPIEELKQVQRDVAAAERAIAERSYDVQKETRDLGQKQLDATKSTNTQLAALRREEKARAKQQKIQTQLTKPKPVGKAASDSATVTGTKGGSLP